MHMHSECVHSLRMTALSTSARRGFIRVCGGGFVSGRVRVEDFLFVAGGLDWMMFEFWSFLLSIYAENIMSE